MLSYSEFRIDQMFQKLQPTVRNYNTVVLHIGANDLSRGLPVKTVLNKYQQLTSAIWDINPTADIILSGLLPRASNQFPVTSRVPDNRNLVLVHYEGDETVYVPVTHGNSKKDNASEYTRKAPSVLKTIEDQVKSGEKSAM